MFNSYREEKKNEFKLVPGEAPEVVSGEAPLTDIGMAAGDPLDDGWDGVSEALTMRADSHAARYEQMYDVALAHAGDAEAVKRVEGDALWGWSLKPESVANAENTEDVLGTGLARVYGTEDPAAVWDAMNASADYEYEQMPAWNTQAEGMRLVWKRFSNKVKKEYEYHNKVVTDITRQLETKEMSMSEQEYNTIASTIEYRHREIGYPTLTREEKKTIYQNWLKTKQEEKAQKEAADAAEQARKTQETYCTLGIIIGSILLIITIYKLYHHRLAIYTTLRPLLHPFPLIACSLLGIATADMPYGYYTFLRIVISIWGISGIIQANKEEQASPGKTAAIIISSGILILYNPIIPIHLDRETWLPLNLISIPLILLTTYLLHHRPHRSRGLQTANTNSLDKPPAPPAESPRTAPPPPES